MPAQLVGAAGTLHRPAGERPRIVSLVPSITELLFALRLDESVVGRTGFCVHPLRARARRGRPRLLAAPRIRRGLRPRLRGVLGEYIDIP